MDKKTLEAKLRDLIKSIPTPPPGRDIALVKTKLEEALLWLLSEEILKD